VEFTLLCNGLHTEGYTDHLREYVTSGGDSGRGCWRQNLGGHAPGLRLGGRGSTPRDEGGNPTYELGGAPFDLAQLGRTISDVIGTRVTYRDLALEQYIDVF
jgi:NAD(P)H dehydrogenase (quinone)